MPTYSRKTYIENGSQTLRYNPRLAVYKSSFLDGRLEWGDFVHISEGKSALKLLQTTTGKAARWHIMIVKKKHYTNLQPQSVAEVALWNHEGVLVSHLPTDSRPLCDHNCLSLAVSEDCWMQAASLLQMRCFSHSLSSPASPSPNTISTFPKTELGEVTLNYSCNIPKSCDHLCRREKTGFVWTSCRLLSEV